MRINAKSRLFNGVQFRGWHVWFAWRPVWVEQGGYVWLERVERWLDSYYGNQYRVIEK